MNRYSETRSDAVDDDRAWQEHERQLEEAERAREYRERAEGSPVMTPHDGHMPLFESGTTEQFRARWAEVQTGFVDDPRTAVEEANRLVGEVTDRLNEMFMRSRNELERQWAAGEDTSTEELRLALQRYRSFFQRLLSI